MGAVQKCKMHTVIQRATMMLQMYEQNVRQASWAEEIKRLCTSRIAEPLSLSTLAVSAMRRGHLGKNQQAASTKSFERNLEMVFHSCSHFLRPRAKHDLLKEILIWNYVLQFQDFFQMIWYLQLVDSSQDACRSCLGKTSSHSRYRKHRERKRFRYA